jgi:AcrR family transcriptional regulator
MKDKLLTFPLTMFNEQVKAKILDQELIDDKRKKIVKAALRVFKKKGFHKSSMRSIAQESKVGIGSIYDVISCKEDILFLFHQMFISTYYQRIKSSIEIEDNPLKKLKVAYETLLRTAFDLYEEALFAVTEGKNLKKKQLKVVLRQEAEVVNIFKKILNEAKKKGLIQVKDINISANYLVFSAMFGILRGWNLKKDYDQEKIIQFLIERRVMSDLLGNSL